MGILVYFHFLDVDILKCPLLQETAASEQVIHSVAERLVNTL